MIMMKTKLNTNNHVESYAADDSGGENDIDDDYSDGARGR